MKYFSVSFNPENKDVNKKAILISILLGNEKNKMLSNLLFMCAFICIGFFMSQYEIIYYAFLSFIVIPRIAAVISVFSQIKANNESQLAQRPVTVDFYADHIVYCFGSTERFKGNFEKHYSFTDVVSVIDSISSFAFSFSENDTVMIPKRVLNDENVQMINNLIENLFKNKLVKVDI